MKVKAWHATTSHFTAFTKLMFSKRSPDVEIGVTHIELPMTFTSEEDETDAILGSAFSYFNFIDADLILINEINKFVTENDTHTSMSPGDIIEMSELKQFWRCEWMGWTRLDNKLIGVTT